MKEYDIVYFLKQTPANEELRYSLRSVAKNFPHRKVWFYGGCPDGFKPDVHVPIVQDSATKWGNTCKMYKAVCANGEITEDFWLFNDDFFIMKPFTDERPIFNGSMAEQIERIEREHGHSSSNYTLLLRRHMRELESKSLPTKNFDVHTPMLINREKAKQVFELFPFCPMLRSLYGNLYGLEGRKADDVKVYDLSVRPSGSEELLSTNDATWELGKVGEYIREQFKTKSKYERSKK